MNLRRLFFAFVLVLAVSAAVVSDASAGSIDDGDPCPKTAAGDLLCPLGTVGVPYSIKFHGDEQPICSPGDDQWYVNGASPPGLTLALDGTLSGTPTVAGSYSFWLELKLPDNASCSSRDNSEERVTVTIKPGTPVPPPLPKLTIGPEQSGVPNGTVGTLFTLPMTASVADPKTWSIRAGTLPPGLVLGASDGLITGTPTAPGSYSFTVRAEINASRTDTKTLTIAVRDRLAIAASTPFAAGSRVVRTEVGVIFDAALVATGGFGTYTWSVLGDLPLGLTFDPLGGTLTGEPEEAGSYRFTVSVADSESRVAVYAARVIVAERLAISTQQFRAGKVGSFYQVKLRSFGGVGPVSWRLKRGPLPRGIKFDRFTGSFFGRPTKIGTWRVSVEVVDSLRVKSTATITITVSSSLKLRAKRR